MTGTFTRIAAALTLGAASLTAMPAVAQGTYGNGYGYGAQNRGQVYRGGTDRGRAYGIDGRGTDQGYDRRYRAPDQRYRGCDNGDGGTVIGAIAGGLAGNQIAGRGDRAIGTVLGGVLGALAGRAIDRSDSTGACRRR